MIKRVAGVIEAPAVGRGGEEERARCPRLRTSSASDPDLRRPPDRARWYCWCRRRRISTRSRLRLSAATAAASATAASTIAVPSISAASGRSGPRPVADTRITWGSLCSKGARGRLADSGVGPGDHRDPGSASEGVVMSRHRCSCFSVAQALVSRAKLTACTGTTDSSLLPRGVRVVVAHPAAPDGTRTDADLPSTTR